MDDIDKAMDILDLYAETHIEKPDESMTKGMFIHCCEKLNAIDILKDQLKTHRGEEPAADIIFHFIRKQKQMKNRLPNDIFQKTVYEVSKDILDYFF